MKSVRVSEVGELLRSSEFDQWYKGYREQREGFDNLEARKEELQIETAVASFRADFTQRQGDERLFEAGESEDLSAQAATEYAEIENNSFELLSSFEDQRKNVTAAWIDLDQVDEVLEVERQKASDLKASLEAEAGRSGNADLVTRDSRLKELGGRITELSKDVELARTELEKHVSRRDQLWGDVEETWSKAFRANMARSEFGFQGRRRRGKAENLFGRAMGERNRFDDLTNQITSLDSELDSMQVGVDGILEKGQDLFGCAIIEEFMFWPSEDDVHAAICVPLIDEQYHFNIQIKALKVYQIERNRGLDWVEPVPESLATDDDPRLTSFFAPAESGAPGA